ncbi:S-layer homology domain-containing protein [Paenibacillus favisporus]|uniref:S-layer homology domain-containing protein n=1 Tax=Paenibacillus favisporus TaxID=221028 RepID=UPI00398A9BED
MPPGCLNTCGKSDFQHFDKIVVPVPDGRFRPNKNATRAAAESGHSRMACYSSTCYLL